MLLFSTRVVVGNVTLMLEFCKPFGARVVLFKRAVLLVILVPFGL